ncbi:hypothetical protein LPJ63_001923 [Coemansia sp. RSA 2711]|nr:hypothetical protein LPJ63_001923 [Coemansia sp. RSA 2711]KAJ2311803.1 hypothetical protein IWW54_002442 [Coemansia sp. RSA 2705]
MNIPFASLGLLLLLLARMGMGAGTLTKVTTAQLDRAFPERASTSGCASITEFTSECATNKQAAQAITNAMAKYKITGRGQVVALISLMAYESNKWQYNINHFPGRPGQGTRAMLMYSFVYAYAKQLYPSQVQGAWQTSSDNSTMNNVRALVLDNDDSFGAAFWYLTTVAKDFASADKLRSGNIDDFKAYIENGVHTTWDSGRGDIWASVDKSIY